MAVRKKFHKILYVLDRFPKLSETFILNEIVELVKRGYEIRIVSLLTPNEIIVNEDVKNFELLKKTSYLRRTYIKKAMFHLGFYYYVWRLVRVLIKRENWRIISNPNRQENIRLLLNLLGLVSLEESPDLIHSHFAAKASVFGLFLAKAMKKPFSFTAHAYEIFKSPDVDRLRETMHEANCIITPSMYNKKYLEGITGIEKSDIQIVRATIEPEKFKPSRKGINGSIHILGIGRLVEKKGFEFLIKSMTIVQKKFCNVSLTIAGDGPLKDSLQKLIQQEGLHSQVQLVGAVTNEDCKSLLRECTIAVLPCVVALDGDRDVCPLSLQEAMAMEIPVISTHVGSVPELINDGANGILVPERNEEALASAIMKLIENPELRRKMGESGRGKILKEFNIQTQVDNLLLIWNSMVFSKHARKNHAAIVCVSECQGTD